MFNESAIAGGSFTQKFKQALKVQRKDDDVQSEDDLIRHTKVQVQSNLEEAI
jgi:hypothetical protein